MKKWVWITAIVLVLIIISIGVVIFTTYKRSSIDGVSSASIRIFSTGDKDIEKTQELTQELTESAWIDITNVVFRKEWTEYGGPRVVIEYDLNEEDVTPDTPVYIFIRYRQAKDGPWQLFTSELLEGNGHGIVNSPGHKQSYFWGGYEMAFDNFVKTDFRVRGIKMAKVPAGEFVIRTLPGGGKDNTQVLERAPELPLYYMARYETNLRMYTDYLNEIASTEEIGWNTKMKDDSTCGISRQKAFLGKVRFSITPGREDHPVTQISWYDARGFLLWCGLRMPREAEFEKAFQGGIFLDGDATSKKPNPNPTRSYPWGETRPDANGTYRCNAYGVEDGFPFTAPVGSFEKYNSPYSIADLAGNIEEWTLDWYTTSYHVGLDGYRMIRGGSWVEFPLVVDVISGATKSPILESGLVGCRGVYDNNGRQE
jgi:formylglycine-generating enzyme required for sulfatase activity